MLLREFTVKNSLYLRKHRSKLARELICAHVAGLLRTSARITHKKMYQARKTLLGDFENADDNNDTSTEAFVALGVWYAPMGH